MPPGRKPRPAPRKRPKQERAHATMEVILAGAERILTRDGLDALTTGRVAEAAGISIGSLYQYYPNKEAILGALLERAIERYYGLLAAALDATRALPLEDALRRIIEGLIAYYRHVLRMHAGLYEVVATTGRRDIYQRYLDRHVEALTAYFAERGAAVRPDAAIAAYLLVHAADGIGQAIARDQPDDARLRVLIAELGELVIRFLRA